MMKSLLLSLLISFIISIYSARQVHIENHKFVDELGRTRIYRGQNAVYKISPWLPKSSGFDTTSTLSRIDAKNLQKWGFNVVRLGVMWPGLEPGDQGAYSEEYLDEVEKIVKILKDHGISVLLDLHQDLFARDYCGEGVPKYVVDTCKKYAPEGMKPFPAPVTTLDRATNTSAIYYDENGYPDLDWCLQTGFFNFYMSEEVSSMFQCIYDNRDNLWDALGGYWRKVASRFSTMSNVLGYELINEPWLGDIYNDKSLLLPQQTEKKHLEPMYEHIAGMIREVDQDKIIFFEGVTIDYWPSGFTKVPGGEEYADRSVLAYHIYCPLQEPKPGKLLACREIDEFYMKQRQKDAERLNSGLMMTEFGAVLSKVQDMQEMETLAQMVDSYQASWMYWQFKQYEDITTITPEGETMYSGVGGSLSQQKLRVLSRTYPRATAGELNSFLFNSRTGVFTMNYTPVLNEYKLTTEIYFNRDTHYKNGVRFKVSVDHDGSNGGEVQDLTASVLEVWFCDANRLDLSYTGNAKSTLIVTLEPCNADDKDAVCHCRESDETNLDADAKKNILV